LGVLVVEDDAIDMKPIVAIILLGILSTALAGTMAAEEFTGLPIRPYMPRHEGSPYGGTANSTVTVRGIVSETFPNYVTYGYGALRYYVVPTLFVLNVTETVWVSSEYGAPKWDYRAVAEVAYDYDDFSRFSLGQRVEVSGWWEGVIDTTFSMMLVVGPYVNDSYVQPVPSSS